MSPEMGDMVKKWHFRPLKEVFIACMERKEPDR